MDRKKLIGFTASFGIFFPFFGQSLPIGIHARILSSLILIFSATMGIRYLKKYEFEKYQVLFFLLVLLLLGLEVLYSDSTQINNLLALNYRNESYYENKLTMTYFSLLIAFLVCFMLAPISFSRGFIEGFIQSFLLISFLVISVSLNSSDHWFIDDYAAKKEYLENDKKFSQIYITVLHLLGVFYSLILFKSNDKKKIIFGLVLFLTSTIFIIIYQQRSAWMYLFFTMFISSVLQGDFFSFVKQIFIFVFVVVSGFFIGLKVGVFNDSVLGYGNQIVSGELLSSRTEAYELAWSGFLENPMGNGYGGYSLYGFHPYPHNIVLESLYELGVFPTFILFIILLLSIVTVVRLFSFTKRYNDPRFFVLGLVIGYLFLVSMKAGDLSSTDVLFSVTLLFVSAVGKK